VRQAVVTNGDVSTSSEGRSEIYMATFANVALVQTVIVARLSHGCSAPSRRRAAMVIERSIESKDRRGAQRGRRTSPHARTNEHVRSFVAIFFGGYIHR